MPCLPGASVSSTPSPQAGAPAPGLAVPVILVGVPPELGESWQTVINAKPPFQFAGAASARTGALECLRRLAPGACVIVVDFQLTIPVAVAMLSDLKEHWPQAHRLALVASGRQQSAAVEAGVEAVLVKGFHVDELGGVLDVFMASIVAQRLIAGGAAEPILKKAAASAADPKSQAHDGASRP